MGWESALPSCVKLGPSFTKGVGTSLGMGCRPFLLGVGVGPSFSAWTLAHPSRGGSCASVLRLELALPRGWPFLSWVGVGPSFKGLELLFGVVVSLPSGGRCWPWVGPSFLKWRLALASWRGVWPYLEWRLAFLLGVGLTSWSWVWPSSPPFMKLGFGLPFWVEAVLSSPIFLILGSPLLLRPSVSLVSWCRHTFFSEAISCFPQSLR